MKAATTLRRAGVGARALVAGLRADPPPAPPAIDLRPCAAALEAAGARVATLRLDARTKPWTATGLDVAAGGSLTWIAHGDSWLLTRTGLHFDAALQLRVRIGGAAPVSGTGPTHTAAGSGAVELCCIQLDELHDGAVVSDMLPRAALRGGFDVVLAAWPAGVDPAERLVAAAGDDPTGYAGREAERMADPVAPPPGWHAHPQLALVGLHRAEGEAIAARGAGRVEIVRKEVQAPLTPGLQLHWRWRMDALPSVFAEDTLMTHDYLSIAVEFDDGKDLTYYWSAALPPETSYRCPLPHWRHREWHLVVRSGRDGLGTWQSEQRTIAPDRDRAIGGAAPRAVTAIWLILMTMPQRREGAGAYADIALVDGDRVLDVL